VAFNRSTPRALERMTKRSIRYYSKDDSFWLTNDERLRLNSRLADLEQQDRACQGELDEIVAAKSQQGELDEVLVGEAAQRTRRLLERVLLTVGEEFAGAVRTGEMRLLGLDNVRELVRKEDYADAFVSWPRRNDGLACCESGFWSGGRTWRQ
jgi:hypothetical protein